LEWLSICKRGSMKRFLGALSIGSGLALAAAPRQMAGWFGLPRRSLLGRSLGVRDIAIGLKLLGANRRSGLLARAASDLLDFGLIQRERRHRPRSRWNAPRSTVALVSAALAGGMHIGARSVRRRGWLPAAQELVVRRPMLTLGAALLLGATCTRVAARGMRAQNAAK
jgi:hypothetical protein